MTDPLTALRAKRKELQDAKDDTAALRRRLAFENEPICNCGYENISANAPTFRRDVMSERHSSSCPAASYWQQRQKAALDRGMEKPGAKRAFECAGFCEAADWIDEKLTPLIETLEQEQTQDVENKGSRRRPAATPDWRVGASPTLTGHNDLGEVEGCVGCVDPQSGGDHGVADGLEAELTALRAQLDKANADSMPEALGIQRDQDPPALAVRPLPPPEPKEPIVVPLDDPNVPESLVPIPQKPEKGQ